MRKLKVFWIEYKFLILLFTPLVIALIGTVFAFTFVLDSYQAKWILGNMPGTIVLGYIHAGIFVGLYIYAFRFGFGGTGKKRVRPQKVATRFKDVIGLQDAKKEAWEVVQVVRDHSRLKKIGGKIIKGVLMMGPPGCGKTYLAKAIACESGIPFISIGGSEFVEMFVGVGASRVRNLFTRAKLEAYEHGACIIFIDEIDAVGHGRTFSFMGGGETNSTLNQLLIEMDGLSDNQENVIVIGATNSPEEVLDKALLRPGRLDRKIQVGMPNLKEREEIFAYYMSKISYDKNLDIGRVARKAVYKSPADIENIVKESALIAMRNKKEFVTLDEISEAMDRIDLGMVHRLTMTDQEKEMIAYHEAGHLITLYFLHPKDDVFKASLIPRGGALGMVVHHPREEYHTADKNKMMADVKVSLAGYVAEKIKYGVTTSGVASDFKKATELTHIMVWRLGMGTSGAIGDFSSIPKEQLSDDLKESLNTETQKILNQCIKEVESTLKKEWPILERFVKELIEKEELEYDEIDKIFKESGKQRHFPQLDKK